MKVLGFLCALLMSSIAMAYPAVGDYVKLTGAIRAADGQSMPMTIEMELTSFNQTTNEFTMKTTTTAAGQSQTDVAQGKPEGFFSNDVVQEILASCDSIGRSGSMKVPAGTFDVCVLQSEENGAKSALAIGDVPFGIVKSQQISPDGTSVILSLEVVRNGR